MATITPTGKHAEVISYTASLTTGTTDTTTLDVTSVDSLSVWWQLQATVTTGDLLLPVVQNYASDRATANASGMTAIRTSAAASDGTNVNAFAQYDVRGMDKVAITGKNNNAGTKTLAVTLYLAKRA